MSTRRPYLLPLTPLYAAAVAWKNRRFDRGIGVERLRESVISVGSLSAGGAGKTPFVIALGEMLRREGLAVDVLSRGHGRNGKETMRVRADSSATDVGDEPLWIARRLACPVYVSRSRIDAGSMAELDRQVLREDRTGIVHLLDDGFQHRQLARRVDVVLLTTQDVSDALLPAGNLREPLTSLRRAGVIVVRAEEASELNPTIQRVCAGALPPVWTITRRVVFVEGEVSAKPVAFCGLARPEDFLASLRGKGVKPVSIVTFRDHARYDKDTIAKIVQAARATGANGFVTTAKDAVKITPAMRADLAAVGPLAVADVAVRIGDEACRAAELLTVLHRRVSQ